jgi:hypothetical protein
MNARSGILKLWAVLAAGWIAGLNLLLVFLILRYRTVLSGWLDLSNAIDWAKLIEANLVPPLLLGLVMVPLGLAQARKQESG